MTNAPRYRQMGWRRMGWLAALSICLALYTLLHLKVNAVHSEVVRAEREIVKLEQTNMLLETEFLTRSNHVQLAKLNRINFGFQSPRADQFVGAQRQLAQFGSPRGVDAPAPIRLAGMTSEDGLPEFPQLVSPLTGRRIDAALVEVEQARKDDGDSGRLVISLTEASHEVAGAVGGAVVTMRADIAP